MSAATANFHPCPLNYPGVCGQLINHLAVRLPIVPSLHKRTIAQLLLQCGLVAGEVSPPLMRAGVWRLSETDGYLGVSD